MIYYEIKCIKFNFGIAIHVSVNIYNLYAFSQWPNFVFFCRSYVKMYPIRYLFSLYTLLAIWQIQYPIGCPRPCMDLQNANKWMNEWMTVTVLPSVLHVRRLEEYSKHFEPGQQECLLLLIVRAKPRVSNARWSFDLCIARTHRGFHSWFSVQSRSRIIKYSTVLRLSLRSKNTSLCWNRNCPSVTSCQWLNCLLDLCKMQYRSPLQKDRQYTYKLLDFFDSFS